jgi:hypothetical protein
MQGRSSRTKGARGEREFSDVLRLHGFTAIRTGRSHSGPVDDLSHDVAGVHFEVKRRNGFDPVAWLRQARRDAANRMAVVVWKRNNGEWLAIMGADELLTLLKERATVSDGPSPPLATKSSRKEHNETED